MRARILFEPSSIHIQALAKGYAMDVKAV